MANCDCSCHDAPDACNKTDWKCNDCGHDLKKDFERVSKNREEEARKIIEDAKIRSIEAQIKELEDIKAGRIQKVVKV